MAFYERQAEELGISDARHGGSTFIQRFGSACNLNVHFHSIVIEGVYSVTSGIPVFYRLRGPTDEETGDIIEVIASKIIRSESEAREVRLTEKQKDVIDTVIKDGIAPAVPEHVFLLHGVTGSGKTEVYK